MGQVLVWHDRFGQMASCRKNNSVSHFDQSRSYIQQLVRETLRVPCTAVCNIVLSPSGQTMTFNSLEEVKRMLQI